MVYCLSSSPRLFRCQGRWVGEGALPSTECSAAGYQYFHMSLSDLMWSEWGSQVGPPDGSPGYLYPGPCLRSLCFDLLHCVFASVRPRAGVCSLYRLFFFPTGGGAQCTQSISLLSKWGSEIAARSTGNFWPLFGRR